MTLSVGFATCYTVKQKKTFESSDTVGWIRNMLHDDAQQLFDSTVYCTLLAWHFWYVRKRSLLLTYFTDSWTCIPSDCFNALRIIRRLRLISCLIHKADVSFLCLQNTRQIDLKPTEQTQHSVTQNPPFPQIHRLLVCNPLHWLSSSVIFHYFFYFF